MKKNIDWKKIFKKYEGIIYSQAKKYSNDFKSSSYQDLLSAGQYGLILAVNTYKNNKKTKLSTWIYIHVRSQIQKAKNSELLISCSPVTAKKYKIQTYFEGLNFSSDYIDPIDPYLICAQTDDDMQKIIITQKMLLCLNKKITGLERKVIIDYFFKNHSYKMISDKYHIKANNIIKKAINMIKKDIGIFQSSSSTEEN